MLPPRRRRPLFAIASCIAGFSLLSSRIHCKPVPVHSPANFFFNSDGPRDGLLGDIVASAGDTRRPGEATPSSLGTTSHPPPSWPVAEHSTGTGYAGGQGQHLLLPTSTPISGGFSTGTASLHSNHHAFPGDLLTGAAARAPSSSGWPHLGRAHEQPQRSDTPESTSLGVHSRPESSGAGKQKRKRCTGRNKAGCQQQDAWDKVHEDRLVLSALPPYTDRTDEMVRKLYTTHYLQQAFDRSKAVGEDVGPDEVKVAAAHISTQLQRTFYGPRTSRKSCKPPEALFKTGTVRQIVQARHQIQQRAQETRKKRESDKKKSGRGQGHQDNP